MRTRQPGAERPTPPIAVPAWPGRRHVHLIESRLRGLGGAPRAAVLRAMARALDAHLAGAVDCHAGRESVDAALDDLLKELGGMLETSRRAGAVPVSGSSPSPAPKPTRSGSLDRGASR